MNDMHKWNLMPCRCVVVTFHVAVGVAPSLRGRSAHTFTIFSMAFLPLNHNIASLQRNVNIHRHVILIGKFVPRKNFHLTCLCEQFRDVCMCAEIWIKKSLLLNNHLIYCGVDSEQENLHSLMVREARKLDHKASRSLTTKKGRRRDWERAFVVFMQIGVDSWQLAIDDERTIVQ